MPAVPMQTAESHRHSRHWTPSPGPTRSIPADRFSFLPGPNLGPRQVWDDKDRVSVLYRTGPEERAMTTAIRTTTQAPSPGRGDWKETLGRVGLVGRGVLYAVIGLLALQLALGDSANASQAGAIEWIGSVVVGKVLLVGLTAALFAMAAWRFLDALLGDPVEGSEASDRARFVIIGAIYLSFAVASLTATIANW